MKNEMEVDERCVGWRERKAERGQQVKLIKVYVSQN
jgi:hypothetical protein